MKFRLLFLSALLANLFCIPALYADIESNVLNENLEAKAHKGYSTKPNPDQTLFRNTWTPYFTKTCNVQPKQATFVQANIATGLLYFSGVRGNLVPNSAGFSTFRELFGVSPVKSNRKMQGRLNYNRTPLCELVFGYQWNNIIKTGLSFQSQTNVSVFSQAQIVPVNVVPVEGDLAGGTSTQGQFFSDLNLYALAVKGYFTFPYSLVVKMVSITPYLSLGVGPCWQTWKRIVVSYSMPAMTNVVSFDFNQKISANAFFTMDLGFSTTWLIKNKTFNLVKGTRFNVWGQARSMGKARDQTFTSERSYLVSPLSIETLYQFAPYIGLTCDF